MSGSRLHPRLAYTQTERLSCGSSAGDYRSVIDDLTIENRKLKQKLRQLTKTRTSHMEDDKLFEVRIHGTLPPRKRRELEEVLGSFAQNIHSPSEKDATATTRSRGLPKFSSPDHAKKPAAKLSSSSSTSNSRPLDSAYASLSNSGHNSTPQRVGLQGMTSNQTIGNEQNIQSFLHNIPEGLLPKQPPAMTARQRKKLVVQRLEQLFTGNKGVLNSDHSQSLQQQEVSNSAAKADAMANDRESHKEGIREATIHPHIMEVDRKPGVSSQGSHQDTIPEPYASDASDELSREGSSPDQRPTRPLDLDPDRAQVPSDNVDYIRHLGLSTPNLNSENSSDSDVAADSEGWIYLNLLINMAQLHIVNVTPGFVREALAEVSERFQISPDGQKVRWRGGTRGTHLSSDSGASSTAHHHQPLEDSDSLDEPPQKRRKVDPRKFAPVPVGNPDKSSRHQKNPADAFHYKPMFRHRNSSTMASSSDGSEAVFGYSVENDGGLGMGSVHPKPWNDGPHPGSHLDKIDAGLLVYYNGAQFCTDLSGDRGRWSTPAHVSAVDQDGYFNGIQGQLSGTTRPQAPTLPRTTSGSSLPFRPFKDYSKGAEIPGLGIARPTTPEQLKDDSEGNLFMESSPAASLSSSPARQPFESSGLGGTRPADHFSIRVKTRRTMVDRGSHSVAPPTPSVRRPGHRPFAPSIPRAALEWCLGEDTAAAHPRSSAHAKKWAVRTEILSSHVRHLKASALPPPLNYHGANSASSDENSCSSQESRPWRARLMSQKSRVAFARLGEELEDVGGEKDDESAKEDDEEEDEDSDGSIDMLAELRKTDPALVAAQEQEFDMHIQDEDRTDVATIGNTANESSEYTGMPSALGRSISAMSLVEGGG